MAMTICDLPVDLLGEIVCRVPLKYMRAVRLTCKKWDTLSKSERFREMHMSKEASMVALMNYNLHMMSVDVDRASTEITGTLTPLSDEEQVKIIKVFHCDGLLLCVLKDSFRLVVWNPYLDQTRWIEPPCYSYHCRHNKWGLYRYALGYDHNNKSYKVLRFIDSLLFNGTRHRHHYLYYEIHDFDSNSWRTLDVGTPHWAITPQSDAVSLNGNTYWLALDREQRYDIDNRLICFDYTSETFGPILRLPLPFQDQEQEFGDVFVALSCLPKQGKLAVMIEIEHPFELAIWVTTMIDPNNVSWTKFLTVDTTVNDIRFSYMGFFVVSDKELAMIFDDYRDPRYFVDIVGAGFYRRSYVDLLVNRFHFRDRFLARSYVPSLVQIKKPPSRKRRTKFQYRPCDQNSAKRTRRRRT